jgi:chemotaxis protein histidine kinase CheA
VAGYYYLTPVLGGPGAPRYPITEGKQLIGRSEEADIALLEPTVSREHAYIHCQEERVLLEDLDSKHGTFVNSKRVDRRQLRVGDIVVFGLSLVLRLEESSEPVPPAEPPVMEEATASHSGQPHQTGAKHQTAGRATSSLSDHEIEHIRELSVRLRKLATIGAQAAGRLPVLRNLLAEIHRLHEQPGRLLRVIEAAQQELEAWADEAHLNAISATESVSLLEIVQRVVKLVQPQADTANVVIGIDIAPATMIQTNPPKLQSALCHLVRNAVEASPRHGNVRIGCASEGDWAFLAISDRGKGIVEEQLERVFNPFVTLKADWRVLGLGLFEARHVITELGGRLELESRVGQGTIAHVTLPMA